MKENGTIKFKIGTTYFTRSICNHDCIYKFEILNRTAKSVLILKDGDIVRRRLSIWNGAESFKPFGSYSMAAIISADKPIT